MLKSLSLNPPMQLQIGDRVEQSGRYLQQWRGTTLIRQWDTLGAVPITEPTAFGQTPITNLIIEVAMPGQNVAMTAVTENQNTGKVTFDFSSGSQIEYANWQDVGEVAAQIDSTPTLAEKLLIGKAYRASPDGVNKTTQVGASVSVNLQASEPIVYTGADV